MKTKKLNEQLNILRKLYDTLRPGDDGFDPVQDELIRNALTGIYVQKCNLTGFLSKHATPTLSREFNKAVDRKMLFLYMAHAFRDPICKPLSTLDIYSDTVNRPISRTDYNKCITSMNDTMQCLVWRIEDIQHNCDILVPALDEASAPVLTHMSSTYEECILPGFDALVDKAILSRDLAKRYADGCEHLYKLPARPWPFC